MRSKRLLQESVPRSLVGADGGEIAVPVAGQKEEPAIFIDQTAFARPALAHQQIIVGEQGFVTNLDRVAVCSRG